ncbi:MAG: hypothetical protein QOG01_1745 [Pseudonocardiales bacterium]|jgi:hypothetical protein|nr:hypothetical protein [Pseudonocardiales bacterium]
MGLLGKALKIGLVAKAIQVAQQQAAKPENRKKINDAVSSLKQRAATARRGKT